MKAVSCTKIAEALSKTKQAIYVRAQRENWPYVESPGRGRGGKVRLFSLISLPPDVQAALHSKGSSSFTTSVGKPCDAAAVPSLVSTDHSDKLPAPAYINNIGDTWKERPQSCRETGQIRLSIVREAREIRNQNGKGKKKALKSLAKQKGISLSTLYKYLQDADQARDSARASEQDALMAQVAALTPNYGGKGTRSTVFSPQARDYALALYLSPQYLTIADVYDYTVNEAGIRNWKVGSYESLRRIISKIDEGTKIMARKGDRHYQAEYGLKILRDYREFWPNFMWCGDHHIFDVFVKTSGGEVLRPWLTAWMDMASRSFMGWCISFQPDSQTIALALAHGIREKGDENFPQHGLPQSVYIDNGKDYRSKYLNGDKVTASKIDYPAKIERFAALGIDPFYIDMSYDPEEKAWRKKRGDKNLVVKNIRVGGVFSRLGIRSRYAIAYHPWGKPIERAFRNVVQSFSRELPGWCGTNPQERPEKLTWELKRGLILGFDEFCSRFYDWVVNVYHKTPHTGHGMDGRSPDDVFMAYGEPQTVSPELLDFALMKKEMVKIYNWGFNLNKHQFELDVPSNLAGAQILERLINRRVTIFHDFEMRTVRVFRDGKFVCNAKRLQRASFIREDDSVMVEKLKLQAAQRKLNEGLLAIVQKKSPEPTVSEVQALLEISHQPEQQPETAPCEIDELPAPQTQQQEPIHLTAEDRYRAILKRLAVGVPLSDKDRAWREGYEQSEEYSGMRELYQSEFEYMKYHAERRAI